MPLYTITTQGGSLSNDAKVELAARLTALHCEMSGVPKNWVHVVFHDYTAGSGFTAGKPAATVALSLLIRTGRPSEYKRELLKRLWGLLQSPPGRPTTRSSSAFRKFRRARRWRWGRSCPVSQDTHRRQIDTSCGPSPAFQPTSMRKRTTIRSGDS
jgi:phenylpyruvate tautomerase PptA (4-oxalocrotonate tautomerase family)